MPDAGGAISNVTKETLYEFIERETKIDESIEEAQYTVRALKKTKKDLRGLIVAAGFTLAVFDETRKKMAMSFDEREAEHRELRRNLAWLGMPLGTQAEMFSSEETAVPPDIQVSRVQAAGKAAGKLGRERGANPWQAGSLLYAEWDSAWLVGREEAAQSTVEAPKRGPGRPPKAQVAEVSAKPASGVRKGKGKGKRTDPPAEPVFAQQPAAEEPVPEPVTPPAPSGLEFDTDMAGAA
jgi:hypothetical protein